MRAPGSLTLSWPEPRPKSFDFDGTALGKSLPPGRTGHHNVQARPDYFTEIPINKFFPLIDTKFPSSILIADGVPGRHRLILYWTTHEVDTIW